MNPISFIITSITWAGPRCAQELGDYFKPSKPHSGKLCLLINLIIINTINDCLLYMIFLLSSPIDIENLLPSIECAEVPWRWNELLLRSASGLALAQPGPVTRGHLISLEHTFKLYCVLNTIMICTLHTALASLTGMTSSSLGRDSQYVLVTSVRLFTGQFL